MTSVKRRGIWTASLKTFVHVLTLAGLVIHGVIHPSKFYMEIIIDRGAIPCAFGSDMLLEFGMIVCIFFHKWIDPAIATAVDATQIFLLACSILVVIESLFYAFKIIIVVLDCVAIALHIYLIVKNWARIKKRRGMSPEPKSAIPPWGDPREKHESSRGRGGASKGRGNVRNRKGSTRRGNSKKRR